MHLRHYFETVPNYKPALLRRSRAYELYGHYERAQTDLETAMKTEPDEAVRA